MKFSFNSVLLKKSVFLRRGFTLIELMVVIAVIGLLASTVLAALSGTRERARDTAIRQEMESMRTQIEIYRSRTGNYGTATYQNDSFTECSANVTSASWLASVWADPQVRSLISSFHPKFRGVTNTRVFCSSSSGAWAFAMPLNVPDAGATGWCIDSAGAKKPINANFGATGSPFSAGLCP